MKNILKISFLAVFLGTRQGATAELSSGADFLKIPVGARAVGLGNAYTSLANDVTSIYWNPAGLGLMSQREFGAAHSQWLLDTQYNFLAFGYPAKGGTLAASIISLSNGEQEARGANREQTGSIRAQDQALALGYGRNFGLISAGFNTKFIQSYIAGYKAATFALDFGFMVKDILPNLGVGAALQNLGPGLKFIVQRDPLPLTLSAGINYRPMAGLALAADVKKGLVDREVHIHAGTEYSIFPLLTLRGGYLTNLTQQLTNRVHQNFTGFSAGLGFKFLGHQMDYAFAPFGVLGDTHRVSLAVRF